LRINTLERALSPPDKFRTFAFSCIDELITATQYHENRECPERITGKIRYITDSYRLVTLGEVVSRKNNEFRDCNHAFLKNNVILLDNTHREGYNIVAKDGDEYETIRNE
jgi:hypothetical protein